jgi:YjbE family integral membrane protein
MAGSIPLLLVDGVSIILIDLLLAGDNALVIAMAVRPLPAHQRKIGITIGAAAAVLLRIGITIAAAQLLGREFIKLLGGVFVIWIAIKVLADASAPPPVSGTPRHFLNAIWLIVFADITMSVDNVLAVAGASRGSVPLIVFGLCLSIPLVVFASNLLATLMDRYPAILYIGAAILGKVGGEMIFTDPWLVRSLHPSKAILYSAEVIAVIVILVTGRLLSRSARESSD